MPASNNQNFEPNNMSANNDLHYDIAARGKDVDNCRYVWLSGWIPTGILQRCLDIPRILKFSRLK